MKGNDTFVSGGSFSQSMSTSVPGNTITTSLRRYIVKSLVNEQTPRNRMNDCGQYVQMYHGGFMDRLSPFVVDSKYILV